MSSWLIKGTQDLYTVTPQGLSQTEGFDNSPLINTAIGLVNSRGGGVVYIPAGTYSVGGTGNESLGCVMLEDNVTLLGEGMGVTTLKVMNNTNQNITGIIRTRSGVQSKNIAVKDLTIDGNKANQGAYDQYGFYCGVSPAKPAVSIVSASGFNYTVTMTSAGAIPSGTVVTIEQSDSAGFNRQFTNVSNKAGATFMVTTTATVTSDITGSIQVYSVSADKVYDLNITCENVEVMNCKGYGFDPHEQTNNLKLINCVSHDNDIDGFTIDYCINTTLVNPISYGNTRHGINVVTSSDGVTVINPMAYNNTDTGVVVQRGSEYRAFTKNTVINGGSIYSNVANGIRVDKASNVSINNALVYENGEEGILLKGAIGCVVGDGTLVYNNSQATNNGYSEVRLEQVTATFVSGSASLFGSVYNVIKPGYSRATLTNKAKFIVEEASGAAGSTNMNDFNYINVGVAAGQVNTDNFKTVGSNTRVVGTNPNFGILSTTQGINAKSVATTNLYTVPGGKTAIIIGAAVRCTAAASITVAATAGIGVAAGESDIFGSIVMTNLLATTDVFKFVDQLKAVQVAGGSVIKFGVDIAATGTSQSLSVDLIGYLI